MRALSQTYVFWAALSLVNFNLLGGLAVPPLALYDLRFVPFLALPLVVSVAVAAIAKLVLARLAPTINRKCGVFVFNAIVLLVLVPTANAYKNHLIANQLAGHTPQCIEYGSFRASVFDSGRNFLGNGLYEEEGRVYLWSYSERRFFEAEPNLAKNFSCRK
ncbi:MAG: hypothetical protein QM749_11320 [Aquabacterium sp.]